MIEVIQLPVLQDNYIYIIHNSESKKTAIVDPALADPVLEELDRRGWNADVILNTHHHSDHVGGNLKIQRATNAKIIGHQHDQKRIPGITDTVNDGDVISVCDHEVKVFCIPGHTLGHIAYYFVKEHLLFCGDTIFAMGCGRLFEGTPEQMFHSLQTLSKLPDDTQIFCAHEYTLANGQFALTIEPNNQALIERMKEVDNLRRQNTPTIPTTLSLEKATNPFIRASSVEEFTDRRLRKDCF